MGAPHLVLAKAVRAGVLSAADAELIGATRIGDVDLADAANALGLGYKTCHQRRRRAESALAEWLTSDDYPPQVGVLVEVNCETDFVAKGEDFRKLAREIALQIAATSPRWVSRDDVPDDVLVAERDLYERKAVEDGKPEQAVPKIVEGQVEKFLDWVRTSRTAGQIITRAGAVPAFNKH